VEDQKRLQIHGSLGNKSAPGIIQGFAM